MAVPSRDLNLAKNVWRYYFHPCIYENDSPYNKPPATLSPSAHHCSYAVVELHGYKQEAEP
jgi:hypothetical protein